MALDRATRYPGRWEAPSADYPMGKFRNYTDENTPDGSYIERDWANDWDGFFGALIRGAGETPNGQVDTARASQYFNAAQQVFNARATIVTGTGVTAGLGTFLFTAPGAITLPVLPDGSMIRVGADSTVDFTAGDCIINAPNGETIRRGTLTDAQARIRSDSVFFVFTRVNGEWGV